MHQHVLLLVLSTSPMCAAVDAVDDTSVCPSVLPGVVWGWPCPRPPHPCIPPHPITLHRTTPHQGSTHVPPRNPKFATHACHTRMHAAPPQVWHISSNCGSRVISTVEAQIVGFNNPSQDTSGHHIINTWFTYKQVTAGGIGTGGEVCAHRVCVPGQHRHSAWAWGGSYGLRVENTSLCGLQVACCTACCVPRASA